MSRRGLITVLVALALTALSARVHAETASHEEDSKEGWLVTGALGLPIFVGAGIGHTVGPSTRIFLEGGTLMGLIYIAELHAQHTVARTGIFSVYAGLSGMFMYVTGYSWGGVGDPESALGVGPHIGVQLDAPRTPAFVAADAGLLTGDFGQRIFADDMFVGGTLPQIQARVGYVW